jgi:hypothetical protein
MFTMVSNQRTDGPLDAFGLSTFHEVCHNINAGRRNVASARQQGGRQLSGQDRVPRRCWPRPKGAGAAPDQTPASTEWTWYFAASMRPRTARDRIRFGLHDTG